MFKRMPATLLSLLLATMWTCGSGAQEGVGVDFDQQDPFMSDLYMKGEHLLYDCRAGHWVCSREEEFRRCERWRERDLQLKEKRLRCAPFRKFSDGESCRKEQLELTSKALPTAFCEHPELAEKKLRY